MYRIRTSTIGIIEQIWHSPSVSVIDGLLFYSLSIGPYSLTGTAKGNGRSRGSRLPGRVVSVRDGFFQDEGFCVPDVLHFVQSPGLADIQLVLLKEAAVHDGPKFPGIFVRLGSVLIRNKKP